jgi:thermitase
MPQQIIVGVLPKADVRKIVSAINGAVLKEFRELNAVLVGLPQSASVVETIRKAQVISGVKYAEPNYMYRAFLVPNDLFFSTKQWGPQKINAPAAWDKTTGAANAAVAVVDTGVAGTNPEFSGKLLTGTNCVVPGGVTEDDNGHGTHVAGIAAAIGNDGNGIAGIAWAASILPIKVLDATGSGTSATVACGIQFGANFATSNPGMRVVENLSLGGPAYAQLMKDAVDFALQSNVLVVAAAGNDGKATVLFPAGYPGVMAVGATTPTNDRATFSTYGSHLYVVAPGVDIYSTFLGGTFKYLSGTSMATPHVSGTAALVRAVNTGLTAVQVRAQIEQTATRLGGTGFNPQFGWGLVNAAAAVGIPMASNYGNIQVTGCLNACPPSPGGNLAIGANVVVWGATPACASLSQVVQTALTNGVGVAFFNAVPAGSYCATASTASPRNLGQTAAPFSVTSGATTSISVVLAPF